MSEIKGYIVVGDGEQWIVEPFDSNMPHHRESPFGSIWADQKLAQMVADVANTLEPSVLDKFVEVLEHAD